MVSIGDERIGICLDSVDLDMDSKLDDLEALLEGGKNLDISSVCEDIYNSILGFERYNMKEIVTIFDFLKNTKYTINFI